MEEGVRPGGVVLPSVRPVGPREMSQGRGD